MVAPLLAKLRSARNKCALSISTLGCSCACARARQMQLKWQHDELSIAPYSRLHADACVE